MFRKNSKEKFSTKGSKELKQTTKNTFICGVCSKKFTEEKAVRAHVNKHNQDEPISLKNMLRETKILYLSNINHTKTKSHRIKLRQYSCKFCCAKLRYKKNVLCPCRKNQLLTCCFCNRQFCDKTSLNKHYDNHYAGKMFPCNVCGKSFLTNRSLVLHIRTHTGEKPFSCEKCFKRFSQRAHLRTHYLTHTGSKPHKCDICSMSFSIKSSLNRHKLLHSSHKPYTCEICSRSFIHRGAYYKHILCHSEEEMG